MKSYVLTVKDPMSIDMSPYKKPFILNQAELDYEYARITNPYIRWEKGTAVSSGDMVVCQLVSDCPRFNLEKVKFVAGSGMFNKKLEVSAVGMTLGETRKVTLPEGSVTMSLTGVMNRIVPAASDDMVERLGLEGIHTLADYRQYLVRQQREQALEENIYENLDRVTEEIISGSAFVLYQEDWQRVVDMRLERTRALTKREGMILEEMTPEQFAGRIPVKSYAELVALEQQGAWRSLCLHLLGRWLAQEDDFDPDEEAYTQYVLECMKSWNTSEDETKQIETFEAFMFFSYTNHAVERLTEIMKHQLKMEE